jgi:hypothetical protein
VGKENGRGRSVFFFPGLPCLHNQTGHSLVSRHNIIGYRLPPPPPLPVTLTLLIAIWVLLEVITSPDAAATAVQVMVVRWPMSMFSYYLLFAGPLRIVL